MFISMTSSRCVYVKPEVRVVRRKKRTIDGSAVVETCLNVVLQRVMRGVDCGFGDFGAAAGTRSTGRQ